MASESKKSFSSMLIYCNGIIFHLGFKDSGFSPPLIHLGNIKNVDFCPICPPPLTVDSDNEDLMPFNFTLRRNNLITLISAFSNNIWQICSWILKKSSSLFQT